VGVLVNGNVVGTAVFERVSVTDCVRVTDIVMDLVNGLVVAIPLLDTVCDIDFVNGKVVGKQSSNGLATPIVCVSRML